MSGSSVSPSTSGLSPATPQPSVVVGPVGSKRRPSWAPSPATIALIFFVMVLAVVVLSLNFAYLQGYPVADRIAIYGVEAEVLVGLGIFAEVYLHYLDRVNPIPKTNVIRPDDRFREDTSQPPQTRVK